VGQRRSRALDGRLWDEPGYEWALHVLWVDAIQTGEFLHYAQTRVPSTERTDVRAKPASASAARAAMKPSATVIVVSRGIAAATLRSAFGLYKATSTSPADRSSSRSHKAVFGSSMEKAWLRRNETDGCCQESGKRPVWRPGRT